MLTVKVERITSIMKYIRRAGFIFCLFVISFFLFLRYTGSEYQLNDFGMALVTGSPLLILFTSARWWESLIGKEVVGISFISERKPGSNEKFKHASLAKETYSSDAIHV